MTQETKPNQSCCCVSYERGIHPCQCGCHTTKQEIECDHIWIVIEWHYRTEKDEYDYTKFTNRKAVNLMCSRANCSEVKKVGV